MDQDAVNAGDTAPSAWAPLRIQVFRALWLAALVGNIGDWMQTVGAQWLLVHQPHAPVLVALVQTADLLPVLLVGLPAGVLADIVDRRWLLIIDQGVLIIVGSLLTVLTIAGQMPPALLLLFTFVIGAAATVGLPAYQALIPDIVPRAEVSSASALGAINVNLARAIGPAIAGVLIARLGVGAVFAINTATFLLFGLVLIAWRPATRAAPRSPEQFIAALHAGARYVRYAPVVRRVLIRSALFLVPASVLWALLPLIASERLQLGASGYGLMLGALGVGAIAGALVLPRVRADLSSSAMLLAASAVYAAALILLVLLRNAALVLIILLPAGVAWIAVLASMNAALQLFLPAWVRARGLAIFQVVLFGAQALAALAWGLIAARLGLVETFLIAAAVMAAGLATIRRWPLYDTAGMDRSLAVYWPEPHLVVEPDPDGGPVVVMQRYTVAPDNEQPFLEAMELVRLSRLRTGAIQWGIYRDGEKAGSFVELFTVPTWEEHVRQHGERLTGADQQFEATAEALSEAPPEIWHLLPATIPE